MDLPVFPAPRWLIRAATAEVALYIAYTEWERRVALQCRRAAA